MILLYSGANLPLTTAEKDVQLPDAIPDLSMHPAASISLHRYVPDPHCATPGS